MTKKEEFLHITKPFRLRDKESRRTTIWCSERDDAMLILQCATDYYKVDCLIETDRTVPVEHSTEDDVASYTVVVLCDPDIDQELVKQMFSDIEPRRGRFFGEDSSTLR